ncbi:ABC transporter ATP-binding protein [Candidatus Poribacteria bacterium]
MTDNGSSHSKCQLILRDVGLWREGKVILKDIDLEVKKGEHWAVLGPNGSGKTMLMMVAAGYQPASRGKVFLVNGWMSEIVVPELRKHIGIVSEQLTQRIMRHYPRITGLQLVLSGLYGRMGLFRNIKGEERQRALEVLRQMDGQDLADVPFFKMSTGKRQICMIGRSRIAENALLLLDEPCAGLDIPSRESLLKHIDATTKLANGPTALLITHHIEEIVDGITHVLLIKDGTVFAKGPKEEIVNSESISELFNTSLEVAHANRRFWAIVT